MDSITKTGYLSDYIKNINYDQIIADHNLNESDYLNDTDFKNKSMKITMNIVFQLATNYLIDGILISKWLDTPVKCVYCNNLIVKGNWIRINNCEHKSHAQCFVKYCQNDGCPINKCNGIYNTLQELHKK